VRRSLTLQVFVALAAGLGLGTAASLSGDSRLTRLAAALEPAGTLWVNAVLMTVLPLVVAGLVGAVASAARTGLVGRLGGRAAVLFLVLLGLTAAAAALVVPPLMQALPISEDAAARFRESLAAAAPASASANKPALGDWIAGLLPSNVFRAAADGALLPLVLFTILFAAAAARISEGPRETVLAFFRGIGEAMTVLLSAIVRLAPLAIFVLSLALAARVGPARLIDNVLIH
jgi:Na+/H+-dicarboxylate symporter